MNETFEARFVNNVEGLQKIFNWSSSKQSRAFSELSSDFSSKTLLRNKMNPLAREF